MTAFLVLALAAGLEGQHESDRLDDPVENCLRCHEPIRAQLDRETEHMPAADGECTMCHVPHAARFEHMLNLRERALCFACHKDKKLRFQTGAVHTPIREGECGACHDPHGSDEESLLVASGNELCFPCHQEHRAQRELPSVHEPFAEDDCTNCHDPHQSDFEFQLRAAPNRLCSLCHQDSDPELTAGHQKIPVQGTVCTSCHTPHASTHDHLLRAVAHEPFARGECAKCHLVDSATPVAQKSLGARLCQDCHEGYPRPNDPVVHWPVEEGRCSACHSPHASDHPKLLSAETEELCSSCHQSIAEVFATAPYTHPLDPEQGACTMCHQAHSSKQPGLLHTDAIRTCLPCHPTQQHGHPIGADHIDPRTGETMTCISCHQPHGSEFSGFLRGDQSRGLCLECHLGDAEKQRGDRHP
jgi:predicted CXXCH cytochrome family protein